MMRLIVVAIFFESHKFFEYHIEFVLYVCVINCVFMYLCIFSGQFNPHFYFCYNQRFACDFADLKYELNDDGEERPLGPADKHLSGRFDKYRFIYFRKGPFREWPKSRPFARVARRQDAPFQACLEGVFSLDEKKRLFRLVEKDSMPASLRAKPFGPSAAWSRRALPAERRHAGGGAAAAACLG